MRRILWSLFIWKLHFKLARILQEIYFQDKCTAIQPSCFPLWQNYQVSSKTWQLNVSAVFNSQIRRNKLEGCVSYIGISFVSTFIAIGGFAILPFKFTSSFQMHGHVLFDMRDMLTQKKKLRLSCASNTRAIWRLVNYQPRQTDAVLPTFAAISSNDILRTTCTQAPASVEMRTIVQPRRNLENRSDRRVVWDRQLESVWVYVTSNNPCFVNI